ncbi:hypothetical protein Dsin_005949 [Dipteronia sinensis]|uniref:Uncharacterized protein n=1 Tax=Dipteronia sinensis TaxID=43782 RepID=A0AAE0EFP2_9ROSI|nr:hypothetical protein Dsin_005949 [Dipteronia sinensis]
MDAAKVAKLCENLSIADEDCVIHKITEDVQKEVFDNVYHCLVDMVQIHNIPIMCMNRKTAKWLAKQIGVVVIEILADSKECWGKKSRFKNQEKGDSSEKGRSTEGSLKVTRSLSLSSKARSLVSKEDGSVGKPVVAKKITRSKVLKILGRHLDDVHEQSDVGPKRLDSISVDGPNQGSIVNITKKRCKGTDVLYRPIPIAINQTEHKPITKQGERSQTCKRKMVFASLKKVNNPKKSKVSTDVEVHGSHAAKIKEQLGFDGSINVDYCGKSRDLMLLWKDSLVVTILSFSIGYIDSRIQMEDGFLSRFSGFYGSSIPGDSNSKYFYGSASARKKENLIFTLLDDDGLPHDTDDGFARVISSFTILHSIAYKKTGKKGLMTFKLDMSKAYDRGKPPYQPLVFFTDDSVLFCMASSDSINHIHKLLSIYKRGSGQQENLQKSKITFSPNVLTDVMRDIQEIFDIEDCNTKDNYLGLPTLIGRNERLTFNEIKEHVLNRVRS